MIKAQPCSKFENNCNTYFCLLDNETYNTTYSYNGVDELVGIRDTYGNEFNFTYDSLGRKIRLKDPDLGTWTYTYDLTGNLISQIGGGGNLVTGDSYYREYNGLGQLKSVKEGNTSDGRIFEEYFYDANGDRIRINRYSYTGGTNETIYTPYKEWMQIRNSSGTFNFYYIYQDNTLVARLNPDGTKYFYHPDHLGSTTLITDQNGNVVEDEFYSPFGESLSVNEDEEFKLYTAHFKDRIENQYYYGSRYYNPFIGRFIQCDKIKPDAFNPQQLNCYSYGLNNPYKYFDWDGNVAVLFQGGFDREVNRNNGMYQIYQQLDESVRAVSQVYAFNDYSKEVNAARDFISTSVNENPNQPVVIIGHSLGGEKALLLQYMLQQDGIAVDLVITIDPYNIPRTELFDIPESGKGVNLNFYQRDEGLQGYELKGANNALIKSTTHTEIDSNSLVQRETVYLTNNLHFISGDRFSSSGGKPIVSASGKVTLGWGGKSGSFECRASSCSATKAYYKSTSKGGNKK